MGVCTLTPKPDSSRHKIFPKSISCLNNSQTYMCIQEGPCEWSILYSPTMSNREEEAPSTANDDNSSSDSRMK